MPAKGLTPSERTQRARLAANIGWAFTQDRSARTEPARRAAFAKFEKLVDPERVPPVTERAKRAESLRKAHLQRMALKSAKARRLRARSQGRAVTAVTQSEYKDGGPVAHSQVEFEEIVSDRGEAH